MMTVPPALHSKVQSLIAELRQLRESTSSEASENVDVTDQEVMVFSVSSDNLGLPPRSMIQTAYLLNRLGLTSEPTYLLSGSTYNLDFCSFQRYLQSQAIYYGRSFQVVESDPSHYQIVCGASNCPFNMRSCQKKVGAMEFQAILDYTPHCCTVGEHAQNDLLTADFVRSFLRIENGVHASHHQIASIRAALTTIFGMDWRSSARRLVLREALTDASPPPRSSSPTSVTASDTHSSPQTRSGKRKASVTPTPPARRLKKRKAAPVDEVVPTDAEKVREEVPVAPPPVENRFLSVRKLVVRFHGTTTLESSADDMGSFRHYDVTWDDAANAKESLSATKIASSPREVVDDLMKNYTALAAAGWCIRVRFGRDLNTAHEAIQHRLKVLEGQLDYDDKKEMKLRRRLHKEKLDSEVLAIHKAEEREREEELLASRTKRPPPLKMDEKLASRPIFFDSKRKRVERQLKETCTDPRCAHCNQKHEEPKLSRFALMPRVRRIRQEFAGDDDTDMLLFSLRKLIGIQNALETARKLCSVEELSTFRPRRTQQGNYTV